MRINHKFYLGQKVKTVYKGQECVGRVVQVKIRTTGINGRQLIDETAVPMYRIEGIIGNTPENIMEEVL